MRTHEDKLGITKNIVATSIMKTAKTLQNQVVEHLREYIEELQDELRWDAAFNNTQEQLIAAARRAKQEIAEGKAEPMDLDRL